MNEKIMLVIIVQYGKIMKELRTENLYSQSFIAEILNIERSTYKEYELQNSIIPVIHLNEFCNYFNVSIDYILGLTNKRNYSNSQKEINKIISKSRLQTFRKRHKLTQQELANFIKADKSTISKYETGKNIIATPFLYQICKKYNISADYLLGKTNKPKYLK